MFAGVVVYFLLVCDSRSRLYQYCGLQVLAALPLYAGA
jgi:hypothetical protein